MNEIMETISSLQDIEKNDLYTGYIWYSDESKPVVLHNESLCEWKAADNPYVIEGNLFEEKKLTSYSIKYIDGEYIIKKFDLKQLRDTFTCTLKNYIANRIQGESKLEFEEFWKEENDICCLDMKVLTPKYFVFVGFGKE